MKISIITVTYNSGKTIEDTIRSVWEQTYKEIEYIVVDGGSKDNTIDILQRYEPLFGWRMKYVSENDNGIYEAMNKGIRMASGDVVGFLNSDDFFTSCDIVTNIAKSFSSIDSDAIFGDIHFVRDKDKTKCTRYYSSAMFRPLFLRFGFMPAHPSFYCKRLIYEKVGTYKTDYKIGADYEMMVRLFLKHHIRYQYIPMDFVTMRIGGISTRNIKSRMILIKENIRACRENGIYTNALFVCSKFIYKLFGLRRF